jgi:hypothetical protein
MDDKPLLRLGIGVGTDDRVEAQIVPVRCSRIEEQKATSLEGYETRLLL